MGELCVIVVYDLKARQCDKLQRCYCCRIILSESSKKVSDTRGPSPCPTAARTLLCDLRALSPTTQLARSRQVVRRRNSRTPLPDLHRNPQGIQPCPRGQQISGLSNHLEESWPGFRCRRSRIHAGGKKISADRRPARTPARKSYLRNRAGTL